MSPGATVGSAVLKTKSDVPSEPVVAEAVVSALGAPIRTVGHRFKVPFFVYDAVEDYNSFF